ncbi:hypothetical protein RMB03_17370 [Acinetobacter sp. V91_7]|uniref:phage baseplate protein n=1 Tax=unclassified Acinetobacter TaxID=196816 RepID=UPI00287D9904|nr:MULTISPECIES: hypothetical protein [unclassified Acinetobacter]MDS7935673.1 hypothetical protein [Acinetobacter sp. V91_4B]MDS7964719.1 hypothetical protein [Acinetobacter sp. V91_7]MDS8025586.1 hypothetical protein [Acinetobacter sp. V91_13]
MRGMPNIPNFKGLTEAGLSAGLNLGGAALINSVFGNYWGIFSEYGVPIIMVDSVLSVKHSSSSKISNAAVEKGKFASYNKVNEPYKATVQLSKGSGGTLQRGTFLAQIETLKKSTLKFHVVTPDYVYTNASIVGFDHARTAEDGAQLLKVNVQLEEVQEANMDYRFEEVQNPSDAKVKDIGEQEPKKPSKSLLNSALGGGGVKGLIDEVGRRTADMMGGLGNV